MNNTLSSQKCVPCEGGTKPLRPNEYEPYLTEIGHEWEPIETIKIRKRFVFKDFKQALAFVNKVGEVAENEQHHPNICLYGWNKVKITLTTHAIDGLSVNDFIVAAKINKIVA